MSLSDEAPTIVPVARSFTTAGVRSYTTHACPAFVRRRTMLPPMRPSPIIPSCMRAPSRVRASAWWRRECGGGEPGEHERVRRAVPFEHAMRHERGGRPLGTHLRRRLAERERLGLREDV